MNTQGLAGYPPSPYIVNLIELQNTINNASGLTPLNVVSNAVTNIQKMVDFDQKRIYTNIISKYDTTPIQITDDINLSNANLYIDGTEVTAFGGGGSGTFISTTGGNGIFVTSTTNVSSIVIGFQVGGRTVFSFDAQGRALYYDPSGTGNRFWVSSATLVADKVQLGGAGLGAAYGKFMMSQDTLGTGTWAYVSTLTQGGAAQASISSTGFYTIANTVVGGGMDLRRNWYLGSTAFPGTADLASSNDVTVIGGGLRVKQGSATVGAALVIADALGNIGFSNGTVTTSSFVVGDQIASMGTSVQVVGPDQSIRFTNGGAESARMIAGGNLGLGTTTPVATLDVNGTSILRGSVTLPNGSPASNYVLTATDIAGSAIWKQPQTLFDSNGTSWTVNQTTSTIQGFILGNEKVRISTGSAFFTDRIDTPGLVVAGGFSSRSPLQFFVGGGASEVARVLDNGNFGIGLSNPIYKLQVAGSQSNTGNLFLGGNLLVGGSATAATFVGNGAAITNIATSNVGSGSNQLDVFQAQTRADILTTQIGISTLSTATFSTLAYYNIQGGTAFYSTLSSYLTITSNALSSQIGPGAAAQISSFSTALGIGIAAQYSTLSSAILNNFAQFSTLSSQSREYASTIAFTTASTLDMAYLSTIRSKLAIGRGPYAIPAPIAALEVSGNVLLDRDTKLWISSGGGIAVGMKVGQDLSGAIEANGLIYSQSLRGFRAPFGFGVGASTTAVLNAGGYTTGIGWRLAVQGDVDISGNFYQNGLLFNGGSGTPDYNWSRNGSNIFYTTGNVGIGVISPSYPLDVAGKIRCFGIDIIPGPGPTISTSQGSYVSPWAYQLSNIYYNLGGVGIGTGVSSVLSGIALDVSGAVRQRYGPVFLATSTSVGIPFGFPTQAALDVNGSFHAASAIIDGNSLFRSTVSTHTLAVIGEGTFGGTVTGPAFVLPSDRRLKTNIHQISTPDQIVSSLCGVRFDWIHSHKPDLGFIAQDVQHILPEAVYMKQPDTLHIAYDRIIPVLVEALKHLTERVSHLEKEIRELKKQGST
jgi:hypothetical protein